MTRRDVKVVQPGLVYVIEWAAGGEPAAVEVQSYTSTVDDTTFDEREKRRMGRERKRSEREKAVAVAAAAAAAQVDRSNMDPDSDEVLSKYVYVAYVYFPSTILIGMASHTLYVL